jgi:serine/threonine protein kinase
MRVIFMITREPSPVLDNRGQWSLAFHDFIAQCLRKDARGRPTATELLPHRFLQSSVGGLYKLRIQLTYKLESARFQSLLSREPIK